LLNQLVNERNITKPSEILNELNKEITRVLKQDEEGSDSRDGMDIGIIMLDLIEKKLQYAAANRPLYFVRDGVLEETKANKMAIGGHLSEGEKLFNNHEFDIREGDTFYVSSDGYADQFNAFGRKLMTKRFKEVLLEIQDKSMSEQEQYLSHFIDQWRGKESQTDDVLVLGVRV
jgi:serine phosphatase RsbU (regulator of sigma subunit)